ncbi:hypothetical protein L1049_028423 [Liquidambar formosana]|uniref:Uncharacterized protein n=1 Tax=Liquidambar formosana TaxID=63359 RepID=A0AAP0WTA6_LIQFO
MSDQEDMVEMIELAAQMQRGGGDEPPTKTVKSGGLKQATEKGRSSARRSTPVAFESNRRAVRSQSTPTEGPSIESILKDEAAAKRFVRKHYPAADFEKIEELRLSELIDTFYQCSVKVTAAGSTLEKYVGHIVKEKKNVQGELKNAKENQITLEKA